MRWFAALLLVLYAVFVCRLTLADPSAGQPVFDATYYWGELLSGGRLSTARIEMLANVALFVPAGLLLAIVLRRTVVAVGLLVVASVCIELAQQYWFPSRVPSLADVEHNALGAALGGLLAWVLGIICYPELHSAHASTSSGRAHPQDQVLLPDGDAPPALRR